MTPVRARRRPPLVVRLLVLAALVSLATGAGAVGSNAFGMGDRFDRLLDRLDRFVAGPPPIRETLPTVTVTARPAVTPASSPDPAPVASVRADASARPEVSPSPQPVPVAVDVSIADDPESVFATELKKTWCAPAGTQMALAVLGLGDTSDDFQRELQGRVRDWESWEDSHNGGWGPAAIAQALAAYGAPGYEIRAYESRADALFDAAVAIDRTHAPVVLLTWRGAHTWVMTGYRADADPAVFPDAVVEGAYILDPWYPRVSSIWGPSDPPGTFQDAAEMKRNFLPWKRPEGLYPDRDGKFIAVVPTIPVDQAAGG